MAKTQSRMLALGTKAPHFTLQDTVSKEIISLKDFNIKKGLIIAFICNHCPYVIHLNKEIVNLANDYYKKGITFIAIGSNDAQSYPQDGPKLMEAHAKKENYPFPYLYDETQEVAKAYKAACTPDFYLFDNELLLQYRGQFDASRPANDIPITGSDLRNAIDCILNETPNLQQQKPSLGCNIKWKVINE